MIEREPAAVSFERGTAHCFRKSLKPRDLEREFESVPRATTLSEYLNCEAAGAYRAALLRSVPEEARSALGALSTESLATVMDLESLKRILS